MDNFTDRDRRAAELLIREAGDLLRRKPKTTTLGLTERQQREYSLHRLVSGERGLEMELSEDLARAEGREHNAAMPTVPWEVLAHATRDMDAAGTWGSANLIGTETAAPLAALLPYSVIGRLGVQVVDGLVGNVVIPSCTSNASSYWLADESTIITPGQPVIGSIQMSPKRCGARVTYSHQLARQSGVENYLRRLLLQGLGQALDAAVLGGSGTDGEPTGVVAWTGVGSVAGASFDWADAIAMLEGVAAGDDDRVSWVTTAAVRELLQAREIGTLGSGLIWQDRRIAGYPARVSSNVAAGTMVVGDWSHLLCGFWGSGPAVLVDPYSAGFSVGKISIRSLMLTDVAVTRPECFAYASSIT